MRNGKGLWLLSALVVLVSGLAVTATAAGQTVDQNSLVVRVEVSVGIVDDTVSYVVNLRNESTSEIGNIYLAGSIPEGTLPLKAASTPAGAWFRGFEAAGTPLHAAVWLIDRVPAKSVAGPFIYQVNKDKAKDLSAFGWVHWANPSEGTAISAVAKTAAGQLVPASDSKAAGPSSSLLTTAVGGRFHEIHVSRQGLQCTSCHTQSVGTYYDPMAQVYNPANKEACLGCHTSGRVFYGDGWRQSSTNR